ncbi:MAG: amino acid permease [Deltaproteobacteria bacterium]|nr:amino acid permease [Deltaproteobacteria bacterium]
MESYRRPATAVVITTAMLSFISYWRAASIVMCDISSTAYYIGGIVEQSIGKAAPWFIASIMLFAYLVRATYIESCGMFVRAGVYRVVKAAMGGTMAKLSVSALLFDYILTGPISSVAAGQYLAGFVNDLLRLGGVELVLPKQFAAVLFAIAIIVYFWRINVIGIQESSDRAMKIMMATGGMVAILVGWSILTLILHPQPLPPITPHIDAHALGWLEGFEWTKTIGAFGIIIAVSHSVLAMSGEETLAQVYREIAKPKLKNMRRAAAIILAFSFLFTAICSFFAIMIIPDDVRPTYYDNLMSGLVMYLAGPEMLRLIFQGVVVVVGVFILAGACNTSIVGANSVLNRVAEDGVLPTWLRIPHRRFGTTTHMITAVALAQIITILLSRGDILLLGEAYAFGVIWSFITETTSVLILRFKDKSPREWKMPGNLRIGQIEIPITLFFTALILLLIGITNFFTKTIATQGGVAFVIFFFSVLVISERVQRRNGRSDAHVEKVNLHFEEKVTPSVCGCEHSDRILIPARDPGSLYQLQYALERANPLATDIIVLTIDRLAPHKNGEQLEFEKEHQVTPTDETLLTNIVAIAERFGAHVIPLVVPAADPTFAIARVAYELGVREIILGKSEVVSPEVQLERIAFCWGYLAVETHGKVTVRVVWPQHEVSYEIA